MYNTTLATRGDRGLAGVRLSERLAGDAGLVETPQRGQWTLPGDYNRVVFRMSISLKRVYDTPAPSDGCRILVERLWPRGLSKQDAKVDLWPKEAAPSTELRRWFNHEPDKWAEFKRRYFEELRTRKPLEPILERVRAGHVTFVFASRELRFNNAVALKEYVES